MKKWNLDEFEQPEFRVRISGTDEQVIVATNRATGAFWVFATLDSDLVDIHTARMRDSAIEFAAQHACDRTRAATIGEKNSVD